MMYIQIVVIVAVIQAISLRLTRGTLQCYSGFVGSNGHSLQNWTCDHTSTHTMPVMLSDGNITYTQVNYSLHNDQKDDYEDIKYCVIFKQKSQTDYHCDYNYVCSRHVASTVETKTIQGVPIKGMIGTLHCCTHDLCNGQDKGKSLPITDNIIQCYNGTANNYTIHQCHGSDWCIQSTILQPDETISTVPYSCDTRHLCQAFAVSDGQCRNISDPDTAQKRTICCCSSDLCNKDGLWVAESTPSTFFTVPVHQLSTMPSHLLPTHSKALKHWMFIGGIIAGVAFGLLALIILGIAIKRHKEQRDAELIYSYTQLSADLADDRVTDDEQMIVA